MKKILNLLSWSKKNVKYLPSILAMIFTQLLFLSAMSVVNAQSDTTTIFNANELFQEGQDSTVYVTGDTMSSATTGTATRNSFFVDLTTLLYGTDSFEDMSASTGISTDDLSASTRSGMISTMDNQINAVLINPPGIDIPSHLARQWIPGADSSSTSVLAAETGYSHLQDLGVEEIWVLFRNAAYMGFVLILVATGFMIMFRSKIGGQTAVTVMNSLPNIAMGLVLVTFSFAIVGLVIDLSRLTTYILESMLSNSLSGLSPKPLGGPFEMAGYAFTGSFKLGGAGLGMVSTGALLGSIAALSVTGGAGAIIGGLGMFLVACILGFICLYAAFKLFFVLVMSYVKILMDLVLGPIYIVVGSLPGGKESITNWIKRLLINSLSFPLAFLILNLFRYLGSSNVTNPLTGNFAGFMGGDSESTNSIIQFRGVIVLAGYFIAATAPTIIQDMFQLRESPGAAKAAQDIQKSASKIPLIGGFFGG